MTVGQQVPTQPSVMVFRITHSGVGPHVGLMQKTPFGRVCVAVGHARFVIVVRGQVLSASSCARQEERTLGKVSLWLEF